MSPVEEARLSPPGNAPVVMVHVSGGLPPIAVNRALKVTPFVALGISPVVTVTGGAATVIVKVFCAVLDAESVTCSVALKVPAAVGVPAIAPVLEFKETPGGSAPEAICQL